MIESPPDDSGEPLPVPAAGAWRDLLAVALLGVAAFLLADWLEFSERLGGVLRHFEAFQLDEMLLAVGVLVAGLSWSSWRRSRQAAAEMALRLHAQEAVARQRAYFEMLFNENLSSNLIADGGGTIRLANPELARLFGLARGEDAVGQSLPGFYVEGDAWASHRGRLSSGQRIDEAGLRIRRADGDEAVVIARLVAARGESGAQEIHAFFTDVTALEATRAELARALSENRLLAQRGIEMLEAERRHIARELHDEMGQWLNALKIDAVSIRSRGDLPDEVRATGQAIVDLSDHVYDVARNLMRRLRPVALDELGLGPALQYCVEQWRRRHPELQCTFDAGELPDSLGEAANITLYRIVQECLTNVARHANATRVRIAVQRSGECDGVEAVVEDDGQGIEGAGPSPGLGLVGMRERVEMLGGRFVVDSRAGEGTRISAVVPAVTAGGAG